MPELKRQLNAHEGFTLIELLIVLIIIGILLAIAVPSYLGFKDRANRAAAKANVRAAIPSIEAYAADNNSYSAMTQAKLLTYDAGLKATVVSIAVGGAAYCVRSVGVTGFIYYKLGPAGDITDTACT